MPKKKKKKSRRNIKKISPAKMQTFEVIVYLEVNVMVRLKLFLIASALILSAAALE